MTRFIKQYGILYALGAVIFFAFVRYRGYEYDAALYLLQVMNYLQPERFVNDVPFMFGNQDSFSIFSPIVAVILKYIGVNAGGILATFFMLFFMTVALVSLVRRWLKKFNAEHWCIPVVACLIVLLTNKMYGSGCLYFSFFEPYLVARVLSEVLMAMGLVFIFDRNKYISLIFFILASCMHPLMGGWALPLWLFYHFPKSRIPVLLLGLLAPLSGYLHVGRLDFYTNDWNPLYISPEWEDFVTYFGLLAFWLAMYRLFKGGLLSKFSISLFWVSFIAFYLQFTGSYMGHLLFYQAQPYRVQWLCMIPVIPVFALFVRDCVNNRQNLTLCNYAGLVLGICAIAGYQWLALLMVCLFLVYAPIGNYDRLVVSPLLHRIIFIGGLIFLLFNSVVCNYIQLAVEQGIGNTNLAVSWLHIPAYLEVVEKVLLVVFALICMIQKKYGYALIFAIAFCCGGMKILPIVGLFLCLVPNLGPVVKWGLLAFSFSTSFFEILSSTQRLNSLEILPLEGAPLACILLFVVLFAIAFRFLVINRQLRCHNTSVLMMLLIVSLGIWDAYRWDSRNEAIVADEKQMDAFFDEPIFPQVKDRGKMLFVVDQESPIPSRINFLTGAYADPSIAVGEIFYKEQFMESNRRRGALLNGSRSTANMDWYTKRIMNVYSDPDTLLSRVNYLCEEGEITHFVTDYANMSLRKEDSVFLDVKKKYVWLYGCRK